MCHMMIYFHKCIFCVFSNDIQNFLKKLLKLFVYSSIIFFKIKLIELFNCVNPMLTIIFEPI